MKYLLRCRLCGLVYEENSASGNVSFSSHTNEYHTAIHDCDGEWEEWEGIADIVGRKY